MRFIESTGNNPLAQIINNSVQVKVIKMQSKETNLFLNHLQKRTALETLIITIKFC